jgi:para-nitrobenzyl esterase
VAAAPWKGVKKAIAFGPSCAQTTELGAFAGPPNSNEDCLYLNVFVPNLGPAKRGLAVQLPVMYWSYGGGEVAGETNDYDGSKLAYDGRTIVVTVNYRMNLFGFVAHPALDHEGHLFGNYGLLDQQLGLKWVKQNIAAFGGDPNNVTLFGQSAGSSNTGAEVLSPLAKGLFQKAIYESGPIPTETPLGFAETKGTNFAVAAGCGSGSDAATAACLRALPASTISSLAGNGITYTTVAGAPGATTTGITQETGNSTYITGLVTDGTILPQPAIDQYQSGNFNHVPLIIGTVRDEAVFGLAPTEYYEQPRAAVTEAQEQAYVSTTFSGNAGPGGSPPAYPAGTVAAVNAKYPLSNYATPELQWNAMQTPGLYVGACKARHIDQIVGGQVPLYAYEFEDRTAPDYFPPMPGFQSLAYHTSDIQYYFPLWHGGDLGTPHPLNAKQKVLSDQLVAAWTNFAWTGNPNGVGNKPWPRYTSKSPTFFAENITPAGLSTLTDAQFSNEHQCAFWDSILVYKSTVQ